MARGTRMEYYGGIYHVIARGNNREYIFKEDRDKGYFIKVLKDAIADDFQLYGYVLMDNHYHFLIQRYNKELQAIMHQINNKYSKYFNTKYKRMGHVFQDRYKAILVQDERYLLSLIRYIHRNPVRAGLCWNVSDYYWSSNFFYENNRSSFVAIDLVLNMLSSDRKAAIHTYKNLMGNNEEDKVDFEKEKIIGDEAYKIMLSTQRAKPEKQKKSLDEILAEVCLNITNFQLIKNGSRKRYLTEFKIQYIQKAIAANYIQEEIGENIKISGSAVRKLIDDLVPGTGNVVPGTGV